MQSLTALEGMTAKNAFIAGLCCLIPSGMYSPCPFDLKYGCLQGLRSCIFSSSHHSVHSVSFPSSWFRTPPLFLFSQPLLKVSLNSESPTSPSTHTHTSRHLTTHDHPPVKRCLPLLFSGLPASVSYTPKTKIQLLRNQHLASWLGLLLFVCFLLHIQMLVSWSPCLEVLQSQLGAVFSITVWNKSSQPRDVSHTCPS